MLIKCLHGFFLITETKVGQLSDFQSRFDLKLVRYGEHYTFEELADAPTYSIKGADFLGRVATKTFEGRPWEVFEENGFVFDFNRGLVVPLASVTQTTTIDLAGNRFVSPGLILPGSLTDDGDRVTDYSAWYSRDTLRFLYSEVGYG